MTLPEDTPTADARNTSGPALKYGVRLEATKTYADSVTQGSIPLFCRSCLHGSIEKLDLLFM